MSHCIQVFRYSLHYSTSRLLCKCFALKPRLRSPSVATPLSMILPIVKSQFCTTYNSARHTILHDIQFCTTYNSARQVSFLGRATFDRGLWADDLATRTVSYGHWTPFGESLCWASHVITQSILWISSPSFRGISKPWCFDFTHHQTSIPLPLWRTSPVICSLLLEVASSPKSWYWTFRIGSCFCI